MHLTTLAFALTTFVVAVLAQDNGKSLQANPILPKVNAHYFSLTESRGSLMLKRANNRSRFRENPNGLSR